MFAEPRSAFLEHWGEDVTIDGAPARGIYWGAYVDALGVSSTSPGFGAWEVDLPAYTVGASLLVRSGVTYRIVEWRPDGTGWGVLRLQVA